MDLGILILRVYLSDLHHGGAPETTGFEDLDGLQVISGGVKHYFRHPLLSPEHLAHQ